MKNIKIICKLFSILVKILLSLWVIHVSNQESVINEIYKFFKYKKMLSL